MKTKIILLLGMIFLMATFVNAEVQVSQTSSISSDHHTAIMTTNYLFDDSSSQGVGRIVPTTLAIDVRNIGSLPLGITGAYEHFNVDYCNMTITHSFSNYTWLNTVGYVLYLQTWSNVTQGWTTGAVSYFGDFNVFNQDSLQVIFSCHSPNNTRIESMTDLLDFMSVTMVTNAWACNQCNGHTFQESINYHQSSSIYDKIQNVVNWNWELWLILEWVVRILFIFIGIALIFAGVYWIYIFISNLEKEISRK